MSSNDPFADEQDALDIADMLQPTKKEDVGSSICAMLVGREDSLKSGIVLDCRSKKQINDHEVLFIIDLDNANLPLWKDHWDCTEDIRLIKPAVMMSTKQEDGTEKLEIDYDRTIQRINMAIFEISKLEDAGIIKLAGFCLDGIDKLLKSSEQTMRTQRELEVDDGVSYQYWNIRNKLFTDVLFSAKHLTCPKYFITHLKTYQTKKHDKVVKEWEDGDWEKHTPNEMYQVIDCSKDMGADGITEYTAKIREFKGRPELLGKIFTTMKVDANEGSVKFYGLPVLRDSENVEEVDYSDELFEQVENMKAENSKIHLCKVCVFYGDYPQCPSENLEFGDGYGNDNIINCDGFEQEQHEQCNIT